MNLQGWGEGERRSVIPDLFPWPAPCRRVVSGHTTGLSVGTPPTPCGLVYRLSSPERWETTLKSAFVCQQGQYTRWCGQVYKALATVDGGEVWLLLVFRTISAFAFYCSQGKDLCLFYVSTSAKTIPVLGQWPSVCVHTYTGAGQTENPCRPSLYQELK